MLRAMLFRVAGAIIVVNLLILSKCGLGPSTPTPEPSPTPAITVIVEATPGPIRSTQTMTFNYEEESEENQPTQKRILFLIDKSDSMVASECKNVNLGYRIPFLSCLWLHKCLLRKSCLSTSLASIPTIFLSSKICLQINSCSTILYITNGAS
jgi:hypothetical protein